jgi:hypothetical protein
MLARLIIILVDDEDAEHVLSPDGSSLVAADYLEGAGCVSLEVELDDEDGLDDGALNAVEELLVGLTEDNVNCIGVKEDDDDEDEDEEDDSGEYDNDPVYG